MPSRSRGRSRPQLSGGTSFTPLALAPVLWLEADLGVTAPANAVSAWADQSGTGNNAAQVTGASQPTYSATGGPSGAAPAIVFTSPRYLLVPASASYKTAQLTWWAVIKTTANSAYASAMSTSTNFTTWGDGYMIQKVSAVPSSATMDLATTGYATNVVSFSGAGTARDKWSIFIGRWDGTNVKGRRNGIAGTNDPFAGPIVHGSGPMVLGGAVSAAGPTYGYNLEGSAVSYGVIGRSISDAECAQIEAYESVKWAFALT